MKEPYPQYRTQTDLNSAEHAIELKLKLNELVWEFAPGWMRLEAADVLAGNLLQMILEGHRGERSEP